MGITISNSKCLWLGFSLRSTPQHMCVMGVYIVWVQIVCIRNDSSVKQNVSRVSRGKALPMRHSRKPVVSILSWLLHSSHVQGTCFTLQEAYSRATCENNFSLQLPWVFTHTHTHTHTLSLSLSQPLQINPTWNIGYIRLNKITIKFGTK